MKKFFAVFIIFVLIITTCEQGQNDESNSATLTIHNQSFTELTNVTWNNVSFANNQYENSIRPGTNVSRTVPAGGVHIFFRRKTNPIIARTFVMIVVGKDKNMEFFFVDDTEIVEQHNPDNKGTLSSLSNTVVWFDDAEAEIQPYHMRQDYVGYYRSGSDLPFGLYDSSDFYYPKNGSRSIAIGYRSSALLHLKIELERAAKLSFWYANKHGNTDGAVFSINGIEKSKWTNDIAWSFVQFNLQAGVNDLIWAKKDGSLYYYLFLDDILIYYTE